MYYTYFLSSQNSFGDNVKIVEPFNIERNQIHFDIKVKSERKIKRNTGETFTIVNVNI